MADFSRAVVIPVLREELRKADDSRRRMLKRTRSLLIREDVRLGADDRTRLSHALDMSQSLRAVYEFRLRLQGIWNRTTASHEKLVISLQEWCAQADASGIQSLREFSQSLRGYTVHPV